MKKVKSLVEAPSKPTFGSLLPFPRRSVWRQNRSSCLSFSLHAESARVQMALWFEFYDYFTFHHQPTINRSLGTMESELFRLKSFGSFAEAKVRQQLRLVRLRMSSREL